LVTVQTNIFGCIVTFFNDSPTLTFILDHNNIDNKSNINAPSRLDPVVKGKSRRIGKSTEHAHFTVYTKQQKGNSLIAAYEITQNECANNGNPYIRFSDLSKGTGDAALFTIKARSSHHSASMVRQLPSMQRPDIYKEEPVNAGCPCSMK